MPVPVPASLELPVWGQITAVMAFIAAAFGVIRKAWKSDEPQQQHTDTVVVSGAFADAQPLREFTAAVRDLATSTKDNIEAIGRFERSQSQRSRELIDAMDDVRKAVCRVEDAVESVGGDIKRGVVVRAAPAP